jgi:DNA-binding MarR family transcriptional regulator
MSIYQNFGEDERLIRSFMQSLGVIGDDLSLPAVRAFLLIAIEPGLSVSQLADRLSLPQQSVSRYVGLLMGRYLNTPTESHARALVSQGISQVDPRKRSLELTELGRKRVAKLILTMKEEGRGA